MIVASKDSAWLMQEGVAAFSQIELNGIRIDTQYLKQHTKETEEEIAALKKRLYADPRQAR
jgi:DNA polymerase I-like protein with 3'-5' exonuclease and polymerase domains